MQLGPLGRNFVPTDPGGSTRKLVMSCPIAFAEMFEIGEKFTELKLQEST